MNYADELDRQGVDSYGFTGSREDNVWVLCPFHNDENPSAEIHVHNGQFYCFSCKHVATFPEFIAATKGIGVDEAQRLLAEAERIETVLSNLEAFFFEGVSREASRYFKRAWFERKFPTIEGTPGEKYLRGRKLNLEILQRFGVRWGVYDDETERVWEDRVILPVVTDAGKLLTWAGRHIDGGVPKTRKPVAGRDTLYGLWQLLPSVERLPYVVVCEGEIDCMWLQQCGVLAVSTMGTAGVTDKQLRQLYRYSRRAIFAYDNDKAGKEATVQAIARVRKVMPATSIRLPEGCDPNDLSKKEVGQIFSAKRLFL